MYGNIFEQALGVEEPWYISDVKFDPENKRLDIHLDFKKGSKFKWEDSEDESYPAYDTYQKTWRHLNFFQHECYLHARIPRIKKERETRVVKAPWEGRLKGFTLLMEALLLQLCFCMPVAQVSRLTGVSDDKIWRLLEKYIRDAFDQRSFEGITHIGIDETSSRKRHDYITLFVDLIKRQTMFVADGKDSHTVHDFRDVVAIKGGDPEQVKEICCDMSPAFIKGVTEAFPKAHLTYDRFHVMKIVNEALDKVRREESSGLKILKGTRFLFLKNSGKLRESERLKLKEISMSNALEKTMKAYRYKELFQEIYQSETVEEFETKLKKWSTSIMHTKIEPLKKVVAMIKKHWEGIVHWMKSKINNGMLEGINSIVQSIKSRARGYRTKRNFIIMVYLVTGKFDFRPLNKHYLPI